MSFNKLLFIHGRSFLLANDYGVRTWLQSLSYPTMIDFLQVEVEAESNKTEEGLQVKRILLELASDKGRPARKRG